MEKPDFSVRWPDDKDEPLAANLDSPQEQPVPDGLEATVSSVDVPGVSGFDDAAILLIIAAQNRCGRIIS